MGEQFMSMELNKYKEKIVDVITNEITWRDYTAEEIAKVDAAEIELAKRNAEAEAKAAEKTALLNRLGITEAEAQLLLN